MLVASLRFGLHEINGYNLNLEFEFRCPLPSKQEYVGSNPIPRIIFA